jgi:hypothetical protein
MDHTERHISLSRKYPPSEPCGCRVCLSYCQRPGWWTVLEAEKAVGAGLAWRMMLEISPDNRFAVLSPAFRGNENQYALQLYSIQGCTFLKNNLCELYNTGYQPIECRFCHHTRYGSGKNCHRDLERDWNTKYAKRLIIRWGNLTDFWKRQNLTVEER